MPFKNVLDWYDNRIDKGELSTSGWSRAYSQKLRFRKNVQIYRSFVKEGMFGMQKVVDFGCGTADFLKFLTKGGYLSVEEYVGIEIRSEARREAEIALYDEKKTNGHITSEIPDGWHMEMDLVVANAAYGFDNQNPVRDITKLVSVFKPKVIIVDFFSEMRPYEPNMDGYRAFDPFDLTRLLCNRLHSTRFILDHEAMPHAFTIGVGFDPTPWQEEEGTHADRSR